MDAEPTRASKAGDGPARPTSYSQSGGLVALLARLGVSIAFTSYQSGIFYLLGRDANGAHLHECGIAKPMGLARHGECGLLLSAGHEIIAFENALAPHERVNDQFDACFVPRTVHVTGALDAHDVAMGEDGRPVFVNTRFNCLAVPDSRHSFAEHWRPSFISALVDEDRCHLNGLAMAQGRPAYVTAVSRSDTIDGWRDRRASGGVVIAAQTGEVVCEGLSMPHSPRLHKGELWVLNSGTGELGVIEGLETAKAGAKGKAKDGPGSRPVGRFVPRVFCPGFVRGLAFHGDYAFVGLSRPRYERFEGLALDERLRAADSEAWCGIQVIDLARGVCAEWFRIDGAVAELYDVEVLPGIACPMAIGPGAPEAASFVTWAGQTAPPGEAAVISAAQAPRPPVAAPVPDPITAA